MVARTVAPSATFLLASRFECRASIAPCGSVSPHRTAPVNELHRQGGRADIERAEFLAEKPMHGLVYPDPNSRLGSGRN